VQIAVPAVVLVSLREILRERELSLQNESAHESQKIPERVGFVSS